MIQQRGSGFGDDDIPQQRQAGVLAVHFAGVDGILHQENGAAGGVNGGGVEDAVFGGDDDFQVAAFAGLAEVLNADLPGRGGGDAFEVRNGFSVVGGGAIVAGFGGGAPVGGLAEQRKRQACRAVKREVSRGAQMHVSEITGTSERPAMFVFSDTPDH